MLAQFSGRLERKRRELELFSKRRAYKSKSLLLKFIGAFHGSISKQMGEKPKKPKRSWSKLPLDILHKVSSHLFVGDFTAFRGVCKSWRSGTSLVRQVPLLIDSPHCLCPCLLSMDYYECKFHHPTYFGVDRADIPELYDTRIHFSKYGWLLLTRNCDLSIFFFNLFTKEKVELPKYKKEKEFQTMCFSSPPTSSDCFVLGFVYEYEFGFIRRGDKNWTYRYMSGIAFYISVSNPVLYKGLCYCLDIEGNLGVFDPIATSSRLTLYASKTPLPNEMICTSSSQKYLVESDDGKLYVVFVVKENKTPIYVFKVRISNLLQREGEFLWSVTWDRVRNLGNRMMYLSVGGSFIETAVVKGMSNKIYLPMFQDNINVFYSLSTSRFQSFIGDYSSKISYEVQEPLKACWMRGIPNVASNQMLEW